MTREGDRRVSVHVDFLGLLFLVWGGLTILIGLSTLMLGAGAIAIVASADRQNGAGQLAAGFTAVAFVTLALIAIAWGLAHIAVGMPLRRYRAWARLAALMLGTVDLLLLPFGTALGGYALWALLGEPRKKLFQP